MEDPFITTPLVGQQSQREVHRYSSFDTQLFSLNSSSPSQVKRALEAHLAETERRLQDASKLGTALVQQQKELADKLKEIERQHDEAEIGPNLRRKLADLEKEYNEIGRETARVSLGPKPRLIDEGIPSLDGRGPASPSVFSSQASSSPTKVSVPSRKQRNQPSSRVHDIEFATEISTSLLAQVRQLQSLLSERDDALKVVNLEKSRLELEAEGFSQRIRALDESEQRYKDENWRLETQTHELMAAAKEAAAREARLSSTLSAMTTKKSNVQRELDELKQANNKLVDDHATSQKAIDSELHTLRRNLNNVDVERTTLQQKVEELAGQNQELAQAVAMKLRHHEGETTGYTGSEDEGDEMAEATPENSPPASPSKATPRHGHLESETLKSSLHHAHRMIQNLKNNIHREKTEKMELKRMLQEARDDLEQRRESTAPASAHKRQKTKSDAFKKPPRPDMLGASRKATEVEVEEPDWEDHPSDASPTRKPIFRHPRSRQQTPNRFSRTESVVDQSDAYQTANETEDAFETADELATATESEAFQTGAESMADDSSDDLTETESRVTTSRSGTLRKKVSQRLALARPGDRTSFMSTASTSDDEFDDGFGLRTPIQSQPQRYRLKMNHARRGRPSGEIPMAPDSREHSTRNSPASFSAHESMSPQAGQSLFAELGDMTGPGSDSDFGTPLRSDTASVASTPNLSNEQHPFVQPIRPAMVDSGVMTEPWEPEVMVQTIPSLEAAIVEEVTVPEQPESRELVDSATQYTPQKPSAADKNEPTMAFDTPPKTIWDESVQQHKLSHEPDTHTPARTPERRVELHLSSIVAEETVPIAPELPEPHVELQISSVVSEATSPVAPELRPPPRRDSVHLNMSAIVVEGTEPLIPSPAIHAVQPAAASELAVSSISAVTTEPNLPTPAPVVVSRSQSALGVSSIYSEVTEPRTPSPAPVVVQRSPAELMVSSISAESTEPALPASSPKTESQPRSELAISPVYTEATEPAAPSLVAVATPSPRTLELAVSSITAEATEPMSPKFPFKPVQQLEISTVSAETTEPMSPKLPVKPLQELEISTVSAEATEPMSPTFPVKPPQQLELSTISALETLPIDPVLLRPVIPTAALGLIATDESSPQRPRTAVHDKEATQPVIAANNALSDIVHSTVTPEPSMSVPIITAETAAQTILTANQIDQLLIERAEKKQATSGSAPSSPFATPRAKLQPRVVESFQTPQLIVRRPGSASSHRSASHPPLPVDHKQAIAAAAQRASTDTSVPTLGTMGPPLAPASAFRTNASSRPRTPSEHGGHAKPISAPYTSVRRHSQVSRRSSMSSFASEIEERFNIQKSAYAFDSGTDPRMIQAITQTMIGEFLWKYTRRTGRPDVSSNTRHRRYFWVHPYTRTLYWSSKDPQAAGKSQLNAKSVAIEAVRVVNDDNPYPPGLHHKSLEIVTPGRTVKFTASTSQRHETWFNALSYLLLRTGGDDDAEDQGNDEEVSEFNPSLSTSSRPGVSRMSISSRASRTVRSSSKQMIESSLSALQRPVTPSQVSPSLSQRADSTLRVDQVRSTSRLSGMFRNSAVIGTFSSRRSRYGQNRDSMESGEGASRDSAEELRQMLERQEREADRLENVRACCDGKHDVGSLSRTSRYGSRNSYHHSPLHS
ncbi:hypothetical protein AJ80_08369 [Polytolypa hystricis UAMH7299]|uniref:PH domain-containing protein n=1 Tax=Polytolypa hystricis (strain UAMH7299) TaxID=1447883 RepID=A0A2B7X908_POLH7|nr:hypothetical protein AJ80_08369 [Polytolypa hystricis UAMH7299]